MLRNISLTNFKSFQSLPGLEIKPITILCGTNSCGKSSILQSILLLKQSLESQDPYKSFLINGRFVHHGSFKNIIHGKNENDAITFDCTFRLPKELTRTSTISRQKRIRLFFIIREFLPLPEHRDKWQTLNIRYSVTLKASEKGELDYLRPIIVSKLFVSVGYSDSNGNDFDLSTVNIVHRKKNEYEVEWANLRDRSNRTKTSHNLSGKMTSNINFSNLLPMDVVMKEDNDEGRRIMEPIIHTRMVGDVIREVFDTYTYLGPLREHPARRYIYEDEVVEIGVKGENAAYIYFAERDSDIKNHFFFNEQEDSFIMKDKTSLEQAVQMWLDQMGIKGFNPEALNEIISLNMKASNYSDTPVSIADVGFGISQIFPIILEGLRIPKGSTLLLEQPEIHLHPNLQMQMADYFIALALTGKNVIVETHSDHVVNRLVRRIVEDDKFQLSDKVAIYFISQSENGSFPTQIQIDDKRGIVNWPKEFFDQTATEQELIIRAGIKKRTTPKSLPEGDFQ